MSFGSIRGLPRIFGNFWSFWWFLVILGRFRYQKLLWGHTRSYDLNPLKRIKAPFISQWWRQRAKFKLNLCGFLKPVQIHYRYLELVDSNVIFRGITLHLWISQFLAGPETMFYRVNNNRWFRSKLFFLFSETKFNLSPLGLVM